MLWYLRRVGVDTREAAFWCAERARQTALAVLPPSPERDQLAACAPIVDGKTAQEAAAAVEAAAGAAWAAELSTIADYVRANYKLP